VGKPEARKVRKTATEGGLRFQAYLPPELALWLLDRIEQGMFLDPSEAVFVLIKEARALEPHLDLRQELLKRQILSATNDLRPSISAEEFKARFEAMRQRPRPEPPIWLTKQED
jgi:hypothetical protein